MNVVSRLLRGLMWWRSDSKLDEEVKDLTRWEARTRVQPMLAEHEYQPGEQAVEVEDGIDVDSISADEVKECLESPFVLGDRNPGPSTPCTWSEHHELGYYHHY